MGVEEYLCFVNLPSFDARWEKIGLDDETLRELQLFLCKNLDRGAVIKKSGGLRKIRFSRDGSGKSGGMRVCYAAYPAHAIVVLVFVFAKSEAATLRPGILKQIRKELEEVEASLPQLPST